MHDDTDTTVSHEIPLIDLNKSPPKEEDNTINTTNLEIPNQSTKFNKKSQNLQQTQEEIRSAWRNRKRFSRANMDPIKKAQQSSKWRLTMMNKLHKDEQALVDFKIKRKEAARRQRAAKKARLEKERQAT